MLERKQAFVFRYRLSTLLALMLLVAIATSAYGYRLRALERQEKSFRAIVAKGGEIHVRVEGTIVYFSSPRGFVCGNGLMRVLSPNATEVTFGDADLPVFDDLPKLRHVDFSGSKVTAEGIVQFQAKYPHCTVQ
jgi:hypothetical protein